jgi:hypothetical protein
MATMERMDAGDVEAAVLLHKLSTTQRDDEDIVLAAVKKFPKALDLASQRLRQKSELLEAADEASGAIKVSKSLMHLPSSSFTWSGASSSVHLRKIITPASDWGSFTQQEGQ